MTLVSTNPNTVNNHCLAQTAAIRVPTIALHRLGEVRRQEHVSRRVVSRHVRISIAEVVSQELETADMLLSDLLKWREALDVPLVELLVEPDDSLSPPLVKRAQMLRVMKTAKAIKKQTEDESVGRMADMLIGQLTEIMPELEEVSAWHSVGQRRKRNECGRLAEYSLPEEMFLD